MRAHFVPHLESPLDNLVKAMLNQDRRARAHAHQQIADEQSAQAYSRQAAEIASALSTAY